MKYKYTLRSFAYLQVSAVTVRVYDSPPPVLAFDFFTFGASELLLTWALRPRRFTVLSVMMRFCNFDELCAFKIRDVSCQTSKSVSDAGKRYGIESVFPCKKVVAPFSDDFKLTKLLLLRKNSKISLIVASRQKVSFG